jgi:hypothetical protein
LYQWLFLGLKDEKQFEAVPSVQLYELKGNNQSDVRRRYSSIRDSRDGAIFNITFVEDTPPEDHYINVEIFVSFGIKEFPEVKLFPAGGVIENWKEGVSKLLPGCTRLRSNGLMDRFGYG